ncbi:hypothetical protein FALBO_5948 [Fusarium albosuccineum]|uniref:Azaphilone pigments biosynthesis cluster protein L N-terminal domain-containing protein n=1 Tax=Fusarium albosuccineum TaxID=1237068 RepID=A0A8H4LF30_9HYPO|nr:hypothetical protein FALBO_5948 [Fusarium albosuccineum]
MAEPISLAASVAGLLDVGLRTSKALHSLQRELRNAPDLIRALSNEVEDIKAVLARVEDTIKDSEASGLNSTIGAAILVDLETQLGKAKTILVTLDSLAQKLVAEAPTLKRVKWCLKKSRAAELQTDLKEVRTRINELLALISVQRLASQRHGELVALLQFLQASVSNLPELLNNQHAAETAEFNRAPPETKDETETLVKDEQRPIPDTSTLPLPQDGGMGRDFNHIPGDGKPEFSPKPPSGCHGPPASHRFWKFPRILDAVFGSLFVGYAGYPMSSSSCNLKECSNGRYIRLRFTYGFPLWFLNYAVNVFLEASAAKFTCALRARRRIEFENSEMNILYHVQWSNLDTIQHILEMNRASVLDVFHLDGRSALHFALSRRSSADKLQVIKFLLQAGADPDQENDDGVSMRLTIAQWSVFGIISKEVEALFNLSECISNLDTTFLHQVVAGHCRVDLVAALQSRSPGLLSQVNAKDRLGYTPLMYAVMRGDVHTTKALLDAGAEVDEQSLEGWTALMELANDRRSMHTVELGHLLLAAGADVHATTRGGTNALHIAARTNNTKLIEFLVSKGARIDCRETGGYTPLAWAIRSKRVEALRCLYDHGADIDELDEYGSSRLNMAIVFNLHDAQRLLLELGANHLSANKFGTLLHYAARFGDEGTFDTLAMFGLQGLDINAGGDWAWTATAMFENRSGVSDGMRPAFYRLLEVVRSNQLGDETVGDWGNSDDDFEDASEFLDDSVILDQD